MSTRTFTSQSHISAEGLSLGLAPALTPDGVVDDPSFFHGFAVHPQVLARGLLTLADVTATRYFQFTPSAQREAATRGLLPAESATWPGPGLTDLAARKGSSAALRKSRALAELLVLAR